MNMLVNVVIPSFVVFALILAYKHFKQPKISNSIKSQQIISHEAYVNDLFKQIENI